MNFNSFGYLKSGQAPMFTIEETWQSLQLGSVGRLVERRLFVVEDVKLGPLEIPRVIESFLGGVYIGSVILEPGPRFLRVQFLRAPVVENQREEVRENLVRDDDVKR